MMLSHAGHIDWNVQPSLEHTVGHGGAPPVWTTPHDDQRSTISGKDSWVWGRAPSVDHPLMIIIIITSIIITLGARPHAQLYFPLMVVHSCQYGQCGSTSLQNIIIIIIVIIIIVGGGLQFRSMLHSTVLSHDQ